MSRRRKRINILLIALNLVMGVGLAAMWRQPAPLTASSDETVPHVDTIPLPVDAISHPVETIANEAAETPVESTAPRLSETTFKDIKPWELTGGDNPFRHEAAKLLSGRLEETDSASRHRILSYCEHLRTSYTTRDIDFLRQVYSDNALIIVGHVVKQGENQGVVSGNSRVSYSIRSKAAYIERLAQLFESGRKIDIKFSDFKVMKHPTMAGIYGVTLRQHYTCGSYSDDGWLFLLWDFRNRSMPLIHVRTWQPATTVTDSDNDLIGISDFNLE